MLLSVVIYNHKLTKGQWMGAAVVFAGISVEAFVKRKGQSAISLSYCNKGQNPTYRCACETGRTRKGES